jgi:excisionase family DNA binding protein
MRTTSYGALEDPVDQTGHFEAIAMSDQIQFADLADTSSREDVPISRIELPMTVKDAARFLGVSSQTVYLWVERRRIPHLRVMGRNIRFLKSDLQLFRAQFRQEVENATTE